MMMPKKAVTLLLTAVAVAVAGFAAEKTFSPREAEHYESKQVQGDVTVAVKPYHTPSLAEDAFGKVNPFEHGVFPVLLVITNAGKDAISTDSIEVRYVNRRGDGIEAIPAEELVYWNPKGHQPKQKPSYIPGIPGRSKPKVKKGPLAKPEVTESGFMAPVVGPEQTASGFVFYDAANLGDPTSGSIYITGLKNLSTGKELFYFEIPLK